MQTPSKGKQRRRKMAFICLMLVTALSIFYYSLYQLHEIKEIYEKGDQTYEQLQELATVPGDGADGEGQSAEPSLIVDFDALEQINADTAAWLYCPDTLINYPVMRADDYERYLRHLPDGTYNVNGSLFLDYNCAQDFSDSLSIIYGHNMKNGKMFHSLTKYQKQAYFEENPYLYLYTKEGNYRIDLMYGCVIGAGEWRDRAFMYQINLDSLLGYAGENTTFTSAVSYTGGDRVVVLSTCSYEFDDARYAVIGILVPES